MGLFLKFSKFGKNKIVKTEISPAINFTIAAMATVNNTSPIDRPPPRGKFKATLLSLCAGDIKPLLSCSFAFLPGGVNSHKISL